MYDKRIKTFIEVVDCGSFSKASEKLFLTKVSIMRQINELEKYTGLVLLKRTSQGVIPTEAGEKIYQASENIIKLSNEAIKAAHEIKEDKPNIRLGTSLFFPAKPLTDILSKKNDNNVLDYNIKLIPMDSKVFNLNFAISSLGDNIDCFIGMYDSPQILNKFKALHLGKYPCCCAVPRNHRLAQKKILKWEDIKGENIVLVQKGIAPVMDKIREEIETMHPEINIIDNIGFYTIDDLNMHEQNGDIIEVVSSWADIHPQLVTIPFDWNYKVSYGIIYSKKCPKYVENFIKYLKNFIENE